MTSLAQTRAIHSIRRQIADFTEVDYRDLLTREFKVASSRDLWDRDAERLILRLKELAGQGVTPRTRANTASGKFAPLLQALWLALYNLGAVRSPDDRALIAFVQRQTGCDHTRFLTEAAEAFPAVEALKAWLAREGVVWPTGYDTFARKRAVIDAQAAKIRKSLPTFDPLLFAQLSGLPRAWDRFGDHQLDALSRKMGEQIRKTAGAAE
ncbi:MAG: regulatory protein GemA [Rhodoblastus sp.]